jgi:L-lysine exporter family protein LysE/ArgO
VTAFVFGLLFGMATAFPVGVQSFVVMNQGLRFGYPKVMVGIVTASLCDSVLILLGAAGASALLRAPGHEGFLVAVGVLFFVVVGVTTLRAAPESDEQVESRARPRAMVAQTVGVSLFNPHAVFETVGLLGGAIAIQSPDDRLGFALGAIAASWLWFVVIGFGASALRSWLTAPVRLWTQRGSGALMLVFAGFLALRLA